MAGAVLYVHGAGNRAAQSEAYAAQLRAGLAVGDQRFRVSSWGVTVGPDESLPRIGLTMPEDPSGAFPEELPSDPYEPLRSMESGGGAFESEARADARTILGYLELGRLDAADTGIPPDHVRAAAAEVAASPELDRADGPSSELIEAAVTAAVGRAVERQGAEGAGAFPIDFGAIKSELAQKILGGGVSVLGGWLGPKLSAGVSSWASEQLARRRRDIMRDNILVAADVLFYQRHGARIREHVRGEIEKLPAKSIVLGHSLGGIILVETLFGSDAAPANVELLVTYGSQSPFLYAVDALEKLKPTIPWLNVWTRYDFVSFLAGGLWPGLVDDVEVDVEVGFPQAHGAYYESQAFYDAIKARPETAAALR